MRAFVAPQDRVIVVGSCPPAPRGSRRPGPAPGERRVVLGAGLPAPRTIPTGRRRRTVIVPAGFPSAEFEPEGGFESGTGRDGAEAEQDARPERDAAAGEDHAARLERDGRLADEDGSAAETGATYDADDLVPEDDEPRRLFARQERVTPRRTEREADEFELEYRALQIARDREAEDRTLAGIAELLDA
ncbi:hypothetical protein [Nocardia sp. NPDC057353]|uniref:hypothetical protein n=1 Tax=Nocardia sp. NPDC057353 TaxID=3346104 RepID=UPI00363F6EC6